MTAFSSSKSTDVSSIFINQTVSVEPNENGVVSTGAAAVLKNSENEVQDRKITVLLGDVNGDTFTDARDGMPVKCIIKELPADASAETLKAADPDGGGIISITDANQLDRYGLLIS